MKKDIVLKHQFVEYIPSKIDEGVIYVSMNFGTAVHKCCCGCGNEVVTPLSPTDWQLYYDGEAVSLTPSIGNWGFNCQSHYWIKGDKVRWAGMWSQKEIDAGRTYDKRAKEKYFGDKIAPNVDTPKVRPTLWQKLKNFRF